MSQMLELTDDNFKASILSLFKKIMENMVTVSG